MKGIKEITEKYQEYIDGCGNEPNAVICSVKFYDDEQEFETTLKLDCEYNDELDEEIFFYCDHFGGFLSLVGEESKNEDFYVKEVYEFINI